MLLALSALVGAALTIAGCYAAGAMLIDRLGPALSHTLRRFERLPLAFTLGAACLHLAVFLILTLQIAYWPVFVALLLSLIGSAVATGSWQLRGEPDPPVSQNLKRICILLFGAFTIQYFFHAWAPEISPDGSSYHLGYVAAYLRAHGFERITTDMYAALSEGMEMLFVPAFAIGQHSAAALVHLAFTAALAMLLFAYGRRLGKPWAGAAAAFLVYASPVVGIDGSSAYNDLGVAAVAFSAFYWLELWDEHRDRLALLAPVGLMAGFAYAIKYTAFAMALYAVGLVALRARRIRPVAVVILFSTLMIAPWMLKNWIVLQNPIAPFGNTIFRNPYFHPIAEMDYSNVMRDYGVKDKRTLPLEVTIRGGRTQGLLGLIFLLAPIAFLALRFRAGRRLLAAALLLGLPYYFNIGTRFLIPALPFVSMAMALSIGSWPVLLGAMMIVHAFFSWPSEIHRYSAQYVWQLEKIPILEALRLIPQDRYLRDRSEEYGAARLVEAKVPKGERILGTDGVTYAYCSRDFLISFQAALNQTLIDSLNIGWVLDFQPTVVEIFKFPEHTSRRFRILQTGKVDFAEIQWSVHEMRLFHHGVELPRQADWRLRAWPNPWEVQLAFDNSLGTRWRTWETVKPGDYLDVDFGKVEAVDEIRLDTSADCQAVQLQAEALDASGHWVRLSKDPELTASNHKDYSLRLAATYEMKARGLHYLLIGDNYPGAADFQDDPEAWGLTEVASGYGIQIYKVTQ
jgi:hypothetical protein